MRDFRRSQKEYIHPSFNIEAAYEPLLSASIFENMVGNPLHFRSPETTGLRPRIVSSSVYTLSKYNLDRKI